MATLDQCAGSDEVFRAIGKSKNSMDQIDKTNINDKSRSYVKIYFQLIISFLKDLHLCRIWDFCHAKLYTLRNGSCGGMILLKINRWTFPRYLSLCWMINISWCFHHKKKFLVPFLLIKCLYLQWCKCRPCMLPWTWTTIFYIKAQYKCIYCATVCNLIVISTTNMRRGGKRDEIWLNFIINLTGHLNMLRHLRYHVFHMCKC